VLSHSELLVELGVAALPAICGRIGPGLVVSLRHVLLEVRKYQIARAWRKALCYWTFSASPLSWHIAGHLMYMVPKGACHCQKSGKKKGKKNWGFVWPGFWRLCFKGAEQTPISQIGKSGLKHLLCVGVAYL
jgi:hypothetical protein